MVAHGNEKKEGTESPSVESGACLDAGARKRGAYICFGVYVPCADKVWLVGSFNDWEERHLMKNDGHGMWRISVSQEEIPYGTAYKYKIYAGGEVEYIPDPYAVETDGEPYHNSVYRDTSGKARRFCEEAPRCLSENAPLSIYKLRLDGWLCDKKGVAPDYVSLARELLPYILQMGYTHIAISGMTERYYDLGKTDITDASFVVRSRQGGADFLSEFARIVSSADIGIFVEMSFDKTFGDDGIDLAFHTDNALYWLEQCFAEGILIDKKCARQEEFLTKLVHNIKVKRDCARIVAFSECVANGKPADICVGCPTDYMPLFRRAKSPEDDMYARAEAMTCLLLGDGKMITPMGDELMQSSDSGEVFDAELQDETSRAYFQLFCSELNAVYSDNSCFLGASQNSGTPSPHDGYICIRKSTDDEETAVFADTSGRGAEIHVGEGGWHLILDSRRVLGSDECAATLRCAEMTVLQLPAYGAAVLKKEKTVKYI